MYCPKCNNLKQKCPKLDKFIYKIILLYIMQEVQTELSNYIDISKITFEKNILLILKRFQVEAFPYEYN